MAAVPGTSTALSRPDTWARGDGIRATSARVEPVGPGHGQGLVGQAPVGVEHGLGIPGRARGEQHDSRCPTPGPPPTGTGPAAEQVVEPGVAAAHPDGVDQLGQREARGAQGQRRLEVGQHPGHLGRAHLMVDGGGHRAAPPAGPEQDQGLPPVGQLPGDHVAAPDAPAPAGRRPPMPPGARGRRRRDARRRRPRPARPAVGARTAGRRGSGTSQAPPGSR